MQSTDELGLVLHGSTGAEIPDFAANANMKQTLGKLVSVELLDPGRSDPTG